MKSANAGQSYRTLLLIALGCLPAEGCGFALSRNPPDDHASLNYFSCSEGVVGPSLDFAWAGLNLLGAATVSSESSNSSTSGYSASQVRTIGLTEAVLWGASGFSGFKKVSKCRAAKQQLADRQARAAQARPGALDGAREQSLASPPAGPVHVSPFLRSTPAMTDRGTSASAPRGGAPLLPESRSRLPRVNSY